MLINRKLLLLLITIVFLVGIQTTFATDINDTYTPDTTATTTTSQIQDIQTNTITHTQENIQTTTNDKLDTNDKQSDTNTITKTSKNSKTDDDTNGDNPVSTEHYITVEDTILPYTYEMEIPVSFKDANNQSIHLDGELTLTNDFLDVNYRYDNDNQKLYVTNNNLNETVEFYFDVAFTTADETLNSKVKFNTEIVNPSEIFYKGYELYDDSTKFIFEIDTIVNEGGVYAYSHLNQGTLNISGYIYGDDIENIPFNTTATIDNNYYTEVTIDNLIFRNYAGYSYHIDVIYSDPEYVYAYSQKSLDGEIKEKQSIIYGFGNDVSIYRNDDYYYFNVYVEDENYVDFYQGIISVQVNDAVVDHDIPGGPIYIYNSYLKVGENNITLSYHDEDGEHPDNTTSFTITKIDSYKTTISASYPIAILNTDDNISVSFDVYVENSDVSPTEGTVTLNVYKNDQYVPIKTVDMTDGLMTITYDSLISTIGEIDNYPKNVYFKLDYNNVTQDYTSSSYYENLDIIDKIPINFDLEDIGLLNDNTVFNFSLYDIINWAPVQNGKIKISGHIFKDDEENSLSVNATSDVIDGIAIFTVDNVNFYEYDYYRLTVEYTDENNVYESKINYYNSRILKSKLPESNNISLCKNQNSWSTGIYVRNQNDDAIYYGTVCVLLDGVVVDTYSLDEGNTEFYCTIDLSNVDVGEHNVTITYTDDVYSEYPDNSTSFILTKTDMLLTNIEASIGKDNVLLSEENNEIYFGVYADGESVTVGNVTLFLDFGGRDNYIPIKTVDVNDGKIVVDLDSILSNYETPSYPMYVDAGLIYNDSTGQFNESIYWTGFNVHDKMPVNLYNSREDNKISDEETTITIKVIDRDDNDVSSGKVTIDGYVYWDSDPVSFNATSDVIDGVAIVTISDINFNEYERYSFNVEYTDENNIYESQTDYKYYRIPKTIMPHLANITLCKNEYWDLWMNVRDEYDNTIYYGTVSVLLDGVVVDSDNIEGSYDVYCYIDLDNVSVGEHNVTITFTDVNGEHPDNSTSFTLTVLDILKTNINANINNSHVLVSDENVEVDFSVYADGESVNVGNVTFILNINSNYIPVKTVDVTEGKIVVDLESILSNYDDIGYPLFVDAGVLYNDPTGQFSERLSWTDFTVYDKMPVSLVISDSETKTDEETTITIIVTDRDGNNVPNGQLNMTGYIYGDYIDNIPFNATTKVTDGKAIFTITDPNFKEYVGNYYSINVYYADENNIYENCQDSYNRGIYNYLILEINDTNVIRDQYYNYIPYVIKNENGEILNIDCDSYSLSLNYDDFSQSLYHDENRLRLEPYSSTELGEYNMTLRLFLADNNMAVSTFKVTVKDGINTNIQYYGYNVTDDSTTFNFKVNTYIDDEGWTGIINQGIVNLTIDIDGNNYNAFATVTDSNAYVTIEGLNLQNYVGQECNFVARYIDDKADYKYDSYSTWMTVREKVTLLINDSFIPRNRWTYIPYALINTNGVEVESAGFDIDIYSSHPNVGYDKNTFGILGIYYDGELGQYNYTIRYIDYDEYYETAFADVTFTYKDSLNAYPNYMGYDYDGTSTTFNFAVIDENNNNVQKGNLTVLFDLNDDGEIDYQGIIDVIDGQAAFKVDNFNINDYVGSSYRVEYNFTDLEKDYLSSEHKIDYGTIRQVLTLAAENQTGTFGDEINISFTLKDNEGNPVESTGFIYVYYINGTHINDYYIYDTSSGNITISTGSDENIRYSGEQSLLLTFVSEDTYSESNKYIISVKLYDNSSISVYHNVIVYNKTSDHVDDYLDIYLYDYANGYGKVYVYLDSEENAKEYNVDYLNIYNSYYNAYLNLNNLKDQLKDLNAGVYTLNIKYVSNNPYINSSYATKEIIVTGTSTINTDKEEYSYYSSVEDNVELTIYDESNNNGTVVVYLVDNDKEIPIMAYYNMQSGVISLDSIGNLLESKYGYKLGDSANLKLVYDSDFEYLDKSQCEIQVNFTKEQSLTPTHIEINTTTNIEVNKPVNITFKLINDNNNKTFTNTHITVTIDNQTSTYRIDNTGKLTLNYTPTHDGLLNITASYKGSDKYASCNTTQLIVVKEESKEDYIKELEDKIKENDELIKQLNDTVNNQTQIIKDLNNNNSQLKEQLNTIQNELTQAQDTINKQNKTILDLEKQVNNQTQQIKDLNDKLNKSNANNTQLAQQLSQLNNTKNNLEKQLNDTQKQLTQEQNTITQQNKTIKDLEKQLNDTKNNNTQLQQQLTQAKENNTKLQKDLKDAQDKVKILESQIKNQTTQINNLVKQLNDSNKTIDNQNKTIQDKNTQIKTLNNTVKDLNKTINNQTKTIDNLTKQIENLTAIKNITLTVSATNTRVGSTVTFTATLKDSTGANVNNGLVSFKVNGETLKDEQGNTIFAKVSNGKASIKYTAQKTWYNKNLTVMAAYSGHGYNECRNTTNNFVVTAGKVNLKIADQKSHENGENTQFVVTVTDDNGNPIKSGQVLIKINGVTLKDANGKTITAKVSNGLAIFDYKIALSARIHDITAVYSEKGYQRTEAKNTLNVTKGEAFIRVDPIKTSSDTTQVTANIVNQFKVNVDSQVTVAFKLNGRTAARTTAINGVINATLDTKFTPGTYLLEIIIGETGMYKSDRVTTTIIRS